VALSFIDAINHGDVDRLGELMTPDHTLRIFEEPDVTGRDTNIEAWRGYASSFPDYVIYPRLVGERDNRVAVLGHTTGSHLGLPDAEEREMTLIWVAEVADGKVTLWQLVEDTPGARAEHALVEAPQ
jgi:hypothetical protein